MTKEYIVIVSFNGASTHSFYKDLVVLNDIGRIIYCAGITVLYFAFAKARQSHLSAK